MSNQRKKLVALGGIVAIAASLLVAQPALALDDDPLKEGELIVAPATGTVVDPWTSISTAEGEICPAGFRTRSFAYLYPVVDGVVNTSTKVTVGSSIRGTDSSPTALGSVGGVKDSDTKINRIGIEAWGGSVTTNLMSASATAGVVSGRYELRLSCQAASAYAPATDRYYAALIELAGEQGSATRTWSVVSSDGGSSVTATTTTVSGVATSPTSATLSATVSPAEAAGTVQFQVNGANAGDPVAVSSGSAGTSISKLAAGSDIALSAVFTPTDAATYGPSTGSGSVTTPPLASVEVPIGGTVPSEIPSTPTGLKLSVTGTGEALAGAPTRNEGEAWAATGSLPAITVTDDDRQALAWTLNGQVLDFSAGEGKSIPAANLGWDPSVATAAVGSVKGAKVDSNQNGGLGTAKPLATGSGTTESNLVSVVGGALTLNVPSGSPAGDYSSMLTLTLI